MKDFKCKSCHKVLFRYRMIGEMVLFFDVSKGLVGNDKFKDKLSAGADFEHKCTKCKTINKICVTRQKALV